MYGHEQDDGDDGWQDLSNNSRKICRGDGGEACPTCGGAVFEAEKVIHDADGGGDDDEDGDGEDDDEDDVVAGGGSGDEDDDDGGDWSCDDDDDMRGSCF